ncbi:hypothetical protein CEUSTIGMA_g4641.t1 [Chlamydomonas eustigma]|uniref:Uncharacterized protein n=1 Tax=Chlamydomonas eustigma TaxID=1157962 RepID=A0A250X2B6_9CHLO|nr:hypothetical protein CEUSTIGMA_g4641.t1 [Chlamydomonas eustigma]|eukprot:GAX77195.1 hypothetical protein CEUSTIGMA_g4641.t1 [Chlamydomonas eustigma]
MQKQDALMMERLLWEYNSKVYAERQCLVHSLDQKVQSWQQSTKSVADSMKDEVEHNVILDQLKRNILHDRCLNLVIIEVFFFHILDLVQRATIIVSTCPMTPSKMAIIHNILEQIKLLEAL